MRESTFKDFSFARVPHQLQNQYNKWSKYFAVFKRYGGERKSIRKHRERNKSSEWISKTITKYNRTVINKIRVPNRIPFNFKTVKIIKN